MVLGVFLHVLMFVPQNIDVAPGAEQQAFLGLYFTGHSFRLPAFFVLAGFFASLLIAKRGPSEFLRNRGRRVGLVLLLVGPVVVLLTLFVRGDIERIQYLRFVVDKGLLHLWFLYYLLIYSVVAYAVARIRSPEWLSSSSARVGVWMSNPGILWVAPVVLVAAPQFLDTDAQIRISSSVIPDLPLLGLYGLFFVLGGLLYRSGQSGLEALARRAIALTVVGFIAAQLAFGWGTNLIVGPFQQFLAIVAIFYLALGVIGLFVRFSTTTGRVWTYLTRTSYWVYLVHLPFAYAFLRLLGNLDIPLTAAILIAFIGSVVLSLASFELLVRRTPLARLV